MMKTWHWKNWWSLCFGTKTHYGGEWSINNKSNPLQCGWDVFYSISTLSHDSWAPWMSFFPHFEEWGEVLASALLFRFCRAIKKYLPALLDEMCHCERTVEHEKLLLLSLFPSVFPHIYFVHSVCCSNWTQLQVFVWDQSVKRSTFFLSVSVSLFQPDHQSWMKKII